MNKLKFTLFFFLSLSSFFSYASDDKTIRIDSIENFLHLANEAWIFEDKNAEYDLSFIKENISQIENSFKSKSEVPYMDFTSSTYWMKLKVKNESKFKHTHYIELARPLTNLINLYVYDENEKLIQVFNAGDDLPFESRPYLHRKFVFPISFPANAERTLIVQTKSDGEILKLPIKFWDIHAFTQFVSLENFFLGFFYGFLLLVFVLFSFFGYALRQRLYIFFVFYVFVLGLFQFSLDGFSFQFFWPNSPWLGNHAILIFAAISGFALLRYADEFLEFKQLPNWYYTTYKVFYALVGLCLISSFSSGFLYALTFPVLNGLSFIYICFFFVGIVLKYKKGDKLPKEVVLAFAFLWLGAIFFVLSNVNILENEFLANNSLKIGSAAEITLLSLAMAGRYRDAQAEKIEAQNIAFDRLEEVNKLKVEQTEKLENQVRERTQEISSQNDILTIKNKEIINSITYAKRLQDAILPSKKLIEALFDKSSILYLPKDIVSGDFYWVESTKSHTFFAVADCTGHGVPGAMVSVVGYNALNRCVNEMKLTDPGMILNKLRDLVEHAFSREGKTVSDGMDICLCVWNNKKQLKYSGAFNPLYLIRDNEINEIKGDKQPIGKFIKQTPFTTHTINLKKKDSVILFSDGYPDQFGGEKGKKLKYSVFKEYLLELNHLEINDFKNELANRFTDWKGEEEQVDDVCVMKVTF